MRCPICNHETADDSNFCGCCGAKLIEYKKEKKNSPVGQESQPAVELKENPPASGGKIFADPKTQPNPSPAAQIAQQTFQNGTPNMPQSDYSFAFAPKKKSKVPVIAVIAVILAAAAAALYFSGVFSAGPLAEIAKAADKTARSKSFRLAVEVTAEEQTIELNGTILIDTDAHNIEFYIQANIADDDDDIILLLKDNILLIDDTGYINTTDISEYLDKFWKEYDSNTKVEWSGFLELLGFNAGEVDYDKFDIAADAFILNLNDEDYINEKLGSYVKTTSGGTTNHTFEIKSGNLSKELANVFGEAFRLKDDEEKTDAETDIYNDLKKAFGTKFELEFSAISGYLTGFILDSANFSIKAEFSDLGKAEIDKSIVEKYKSHLANRPSF